MENPPVKPLDGFKRREKTEHRHKDVLVGYLFFFFFSEGPKEGT